MLRELHISNLAVIEDTVVEPESGLNCFTGETGAGKSLVLGAFELLLGLRTGGAEMVRPGAAEARISGVFELRDQSVAREASALTDMSIKAGDALMITRRFLAGGRSSVSVNGQPATAAMVRALGELLVDVHGQHDHQTLLKPSYQLDMLDALGRTIELRERFAALYIKLRNLKKQQAALSASQRLRRQQLELYEFQAGEIDAAAIVEGEYRELRDRHAKLSNLQKIKKDAGGAYAALHENEGAIVERLQMIAHVLTEVAELDPELKDLAEQVRTSTLTLQDSAFELGRYVDRLDLDAGELAQIEDRLNTINRLAAKYAKTISDELCSNSRQIDRGSQAADPINTVLAYRKMLDGEIGRLKQEDAVSSSIDHDIAADEIALREAGAKLSAARRKTAARLQPLVEAELHELGMPEAAFEVEFAASANAEQPIDEIGEAAAPAPTSEAATGNSPLGAGTNTGSPTGLDRIEMLVRTNPGQPARPLRKIASGGELSRIMLAIKSILAQKDRVSVLVFDEIDANIGGRMGTVIGQKLRQLTRAGNQQVLCITHLPQIAAFADRHLKIAKMVSGKGKNKTTQTTVTPLEGPKRIEELAAMLAGAAATETTRLQAKEMLETAIAR